MSPQFDANEPRAGHVWNGRHNETPLAGCSLDEGRAADVPEVYGFLAQEDDPRDYDLGEGG